MCGWEEILAAPNLAFCEKWTSDLKFLAPQPVSFELIGKTSGMIDRHYTEHLLVLTSVSWSKVYVSGHPD